MVGAKMMQFIPEASNMFKLEKLYCTVLRIKSQSHTFSIKASKDSTC